VGVKFIQADKTIMSTKNKVILQFT